MDSYLPRDKGVLNITRCREGGIFRELGVMHHFLQSEMPPTPERLNSIIEQATQSLENLITRPMYSSGVDYSSLRGQRVVPIIVLVETQTVVHKYMPAPIDLGTPEKRWDIDQTPTKKEKQPNTNTLTLLL